MGVAGSQPTARSPTAPTSSGVFDDLEAVGVDPDARAHGGRDRDLADVAALGRGGLGPLDLVEDGTEVGLQGRQIDADLADRHVHVAVADGAVLDLAALELLDGLADVHGDRDGLGLGNKAPGAETTAVLAHQNGRAGGAARGVTYSKISVD